MTATNLEGERLRDVELALLAECRAAIVRDAQRALLAKLLDDGEGTIDDVRAVVTLPPEHPPLPDPTPNAPEQRTLFD